MKKTYKLRAPLLKLHGKGFRQKMPSKLKNRDGKPFNEPDLVAAYKVLLKEKGEQNE